MNCSTFTSNCSYAMKTCDPWCSTCKIMLDIMWNKLQISKSVKKHAHVLKEPYLDSEVYHVVIFSLHFFTRRNSPNLCQPVLVHHQLQPSSELARSHLRSNHPIFAAEFWQPGADWGIYISKIPSTFWKYQPNTQMPHGTGIFTYIYLWMWPYSTFHVGKSIHGASGKLLSAYALVKKVPTIWRKSKNLWFPAPPPRKKNQALLVAKTSLKIITIDWILTVTDKGI